MSFFIQKNIKNLKYKFIKFYAYKSVKLRYFLLKLKGEKRLAERYKSYSHEKLCSYKLKNTKWGCSYSVFDGVELLERSLKSIRGACNYINVVYSDVSWYGKKSDEPILPVLEDLKEKKLIDEIIFYEPDLNLSAGENELKKRNLGLKYAKKADVDYFMTIDVDEFYLQEEMEIAKRKIIALGITHSFCNIIDYFVLPVFAYRTSKNCVSFFSKLNWNSVLKLNEKTITLVDPTRQMSDCFKSKYYLLLCIEMHHMALIRKNVISKFRNSSASIYLEGLNSLDKLIKNDLKDVFRTNDLFNLKDLAQKLLRKQTDTNFDFDSV